MKYIKSQRYNTPEIVSKIMGPNPIKLTEELLDGNLIAPHSRVCDLGSGMGVTSLFIAREYGFHVYAADLWSVPAENQAFFASQGLNEKQITAVRADATNLPFERDFFDAVVSVDSYNYFGRDSAYLDDKLLPCVKSGGYIYIAIPGLKHDFPDGNYPSEMLLSWTPDQLAYMRDIDYWRGIVSASRGARLIEISEMESNENVWADWLQQDNEYAVHDRLSMNAGAGKYFNFIKIVLQKK